MRFFSINKKNIAYFFFLLSLIAPIISLAQSEEDTVDPAWYLTNPAARGPIEPEAPEGATCLANPYTPTTSSSGGSGSYFVNTREIEGNLLNLTRGINTNTGNSKEILENICIYIQDIQRIQSRLELKEFSKDMEARLEAQTKVESYTLEMIGLVHGENYADYTEEEVDEGAENIANESFYLTDPAQEYLQEAQRVRAIFTEDLLKSGNIFAKDLAPILAVDRRDNSEVQPSNSTSNTSSSASGISKATKDKSLFGFFSGISQAAAGVLGLSDTANDGPATQQSQKNYAADTASSFTKEDYEKLLYRPNELTGYSYLQNLVKMTETQNNPRGALLGTFGSLNQQQSWALDQVDKLLTYGQGFLPVRNCVEKTADGQYCRNRVTVQPGYTVAEMYNAAMNSRLTGLHHQDELSDGGGNSGSSPAKDHIIKPYDIDKRTQPGSGETPAGGDGRKDDEGNWDGDDDLNGEDLDDDNDGVPDEEDEDPFDEDVPGPQLTLNFTTKRTLNNKALLAWTSTAAEYCSASTNWVTAHDAIVEDSKVYKPEGRRISSQSSVIELDLPLGIKVAWQTYDGESEERTLTTNVALSNNTGQLDRKAIVTVPTGLAAGSILRLAFNIDENGSSNRISYTLPANYTSRDIVAFFQTEITSRRRAETSYLRAYNFSYEDDRIIISTKPEYGITCIKGDQTKRVTVTCTESNAECAQQAN